MRQTLRMGLPVVLAGIAISVAIQMEWRAQRATDGICLPTSTRLSDADTLEAARAYRDKLAEISEWTIPPGPCCHLLPDTALRVEEQPSARERRRGLHRAQVDIFLQNLDGTLMSRRVIVTNCGDIRTSYFD